MSFASSSGGTRSLASSTGTGASGGSGSTASSSASGGDASKHDVRGASFVAAHEQHVREQRAREPAEVASAPRADLDAVDALEHHRELARHLSLPHGCSEQHPDHACRAHDGHGLARGLDRQFDPVPRIVGLGSAPQRDRSAQTPCREEHRRALERQLGGGHRRVECRLCLSRALDDKREAIRGRDPHVGRLRAQRADELRDRVAQRGIVVGADRITAAHFGDLDEGSPNERDDVSCGANASS
ncbi:MAG: hypothetical protein ACKV2T_12385 [Kofleriaceae bacterium]